MSGPSPYLRLAKRTGGDPDVIFRTAAEQGCDPPHLARLADVLRDRHEGWRLGRGPRNALIAALLDSGWNPTKIATTLGCSRTTVHRRMEERAEAAKAPPINGLNKRRNRSDSRPRVSFPILSFDATGTDWEEHRQLLARLGGQP
jgi:hypothetical protein